MKPNESVTPARREHLVSATITAPSMQVSAEATVTQPQHAREQIQFVIDFVERDLSRVRQTEWPALSLELMEFFRGQALRARAGPERGRLPKRYPKKMLLELQGEVRRVLQRMLSVPARERSTTSASVRFVATVTYGIQRDRGRLVLKMTGPLRDLFMTVLVHALRDVGPEVVKRCVCGRYFVKMRRQKYCRDPECAERRTKTYWAAYVNSDKGVAARKRQYAKAGGWTFGGRLARKAGSSLRPTTRGRAKGERGR